MVGFENYEVKPWNDCSEITTYAGKKQILFIFIHEEAGNEIGHLFHLLSDSTIAVLYLQ